MAIWIDLYVKALLAVWRNSKIQQELAVRNKFMKRGYLLPRLVAVPLEFNNL